MLFKYCPRCNSNYWSNFQTGNNQNETYYYTSFCNNCHLFSFKYNCKPNNDNKILEACRLTIDKYNIYINYAYNTTDVKLIDSGKILFSLKTVLKLNLSSTDEEILSKIKKLILFS